MSRSPRDRASSRVLSLSVLVALAARGHAQQEEPQKDHALDPFAGALREWLAARAEDSGVEEALARVEQCVASLDGEGSTGPVLSRPADVGRAAWLARGYATKDVKRGKVTTEELRDGNFARAGLEFAYRVPKDYDPKTSDYPLLLTLPDVDEPPAQHLRSHWIHGELLERALLVSPALPADPDTWTEVAVHGRPAGLCHVLTVLEHALDTFAVDFDRVYVVGRGRSVAAAMAAVHHAPQRFAGLVGRAGDAGAFAPDNFTNVPTLFTMSGERAAAFQTGLRALDNEGCEIAAEDDEASVWAWIQAHRREARPKRVMLVVGKPWPTRAYWLRVAPSAPEARAWASRDGNRIRVSAQGCSQVTLYLDEALVDLDSPLRVVLNGVEHEAAVARSLASTLELLRDGTSDPGCAWVAEVSFDTTEEDASASAPASEADAKFETEWASAGERVADLWQLHLWTASSERAEQGQRVLRKILRLAPDHADARAALGHFGSPGRWFPSYAALARFQRSQQEDVAEARGLVLQGESWIHRDERVRAVEGLVKDFPTGQWLSQVDLRRLREGWVRQDLAWIDPADAPHVDQGLWLVGGDWVDLPTADRRHTSLDAMWHIPSREVLLHATTPRDVALRAIEHMGRAVEDLSKVFGAEPPLPLEVTLLRDEEQYDLFAFGSPDGRRPGTESARLHLVESAYFAETWFARARGKSVFRGMGVTYWDALAPNGDGYGVHAARLALGLSYVEALDPSPKAVKKALSGGPRDGYHEAYQAEKLLPAWLRYGGAVYAQRYFEDETVGEGGDPWWARTWSLDNLRKRGGLRPLADVLAFRLEPDDRGDGLRLLLEAGLLVSFIVDGECPPVAAAHAELKRALASGSARKAQVEALTAALVANESALRAHGGL